MPKTINQKVIFKNTNAADLYDLYMNSKKHSASTGGGEVKISEKERTEWSAHGGYCWGKNIHLRKGSLIVQTWRANDWKKSDADSTFILHFGQQGNDTAVTMLHVGVPDNQADPLGDGWKEFYWKPWRNYLARKKQEVAADM